MVMMMVMFVGKCKFGIFPWALFEVHSQTMTPGKVPNYNLPVVSLSLLLMQTIWDFKGQ